MLVQEILEENTDLMKTYSDAGKYIVNQDGVKYGEAIDIAEFISSGKIRYTESEEFIPVEEPEK